MTLLPELRLSDTVKARTAPAASVTVASATEIDGGPAIVAEVEWLSFRPSPVQIDLSSVQPTAAGSVILICSVPRGSTVIVQLWFLLAAGGFWRLALMTSAWTSVNERSRKRR